jgi:hypothetical protein
MRGKVGLIEVDRVVPVSRPLCHGKTLALSVMTGGQGMEAMYLKRKHEHG